MKKRMVSLLLALCLLVSLVPAFTPQTQALDLMAIFDVAGNLTRGTMNAVEQAKQEKWNFGEALTGTFKSIGKELLGLEDDKDTPSSTIIVNEVDLSEVELELSKIQGELKKQNLTLTQLKQDMTANTKAISAQLSDLGNKIEDSTKQLQYYTYLNGYFTFYNQFYEAVSYYDQALSTLYAGNPTQSNIKNTFDQLYGLENVAYDGNFYSAIDLLGKYLCDEYMSTDPGSVVDILCQYYTLAGYSEAETAAAVKDFVAQTYYTYCLANYYYLSMALYQNTYLEDNSLTDYETDFGTKLNAAQIEMWAKNILDRSAKTMVHVFSDLNRHFCSVENLGVSYYNPAGYWIGRTLDSSKMNVEPGSKLTMPDTSDMLDAYLGDGYSDLFGGMCTYRYSTSSEAVTINGNEISFTGLKDGESITVDVNCTVGNVSQKLHTYTFTGKTGKLGGGYGTQEYPYMIYTKDDFKAFTCLTTDVEKPYVSLNADLDFGESGQKGKVDTVLYEFKGVFDGNGHTISNIENTSDRQNAGLFSSVSGQIRDLTVKNIRIQPYGGGQHYNVGVLVGYLMPGGKLYRCETIDSSASYVDENSGSGYVGCIAGKVDGATVEYCISRNTNATVGRDGTPGCVGGIVGYLTNKSTLHGCGREKGQLWMLELDFSRANDNNSAGGLAGEAYSSKITECWIFRTEDCATDDFNYNSKNTGIFLGQYNQLLEAYSNVCYNGKNAKTTTVQFRECGGTLQGGVAFRALYSDNFAELSVVKDSPYLTNDTSITGNPIRLKSDYSIELDTSAVKKSYAYGEQLLMNGLKVNLLRGGAQISTNLSYTISTDYNPNQAGTYTVTICASHGTKASYQVTVGQKPHVFKQVLEPSTCTQAGSVYYICQDTGCGEIYDRQTLPARGHMLTHYDAIPAQCNEIGRKEHWHCNVCDQYFLDADATQVTTVGNVEEFGTSHDFATPTYTWSETTNGYVCTASVSCKREDCPAYPASSPLTENGVVSVQIEAAATCLKTGLAVCTATFQNSAFTTQTKEFELPKLNCPSAVFTDVNRALWYHDGIDFALSNGLFFGATTTTFEPDSSMTRGMLVTVLYRLEGSPATEGENPFTDVVNNFYYTTPIIWASENGIVSGTGNGRFDPELSITREEMAAILYRYAKYKGYDVSAAADLSVYPDANTVSSWAREAISWANAEGLVSGSKENGVVLLQPNGDATRAQVASILMRYVKNIVQ